MPLGCLAYSVLNKQFVQRRAGRFPGIYFNQQAPMHFLRIPKRSGGFRVLCIPHKSMKLFLRRIARRQLGFALAENCFGNLVVHGFVKNRNPVSNAFLHTGFRFTVTFDLKDFFDTVKPEMLKGIIPDKLISICMPCGRAWQGLPTSPAIANLAAVALDNRILAFVNTLEEPVAYTRYADDLAFSCGLPRTVGRLIAELPKLVRAAGFRVNRRKTKVQDGRRGRRIICGVAVDSDVHPTRATKRKLRAAMHNGDKAATEGLKLWMAAKPPEKFLTRLDKIRQTADFMAPRMEYITQL